MGKSSKDKRDAYYRLAKEQGWRARSAFKLLQLDEEFNLFHNVTRVVDLCAAPGSWSQVLSRVLIKGETFGRAAWTEKQAHLRQAAFGIVEKGEDGGSAPTAGQEKAEVAKKAEPRKDVKIVAIDLQPMAPLPGITMLRADITHPSTIPLLLQALDPSPPTSTPTPAPTTTTSTPTELPATTSTHPVDLILSDGAPDVTGLHSLDIYVQSQLLYAALNLALCVLRPGGTFVAKIFRAKDVDLLYAQLRLVFARVTVAKPRSSRASSLEAFIVCEGFRPPPGGVGGGLEDPIGAGRELEGEVAEKVGPGRWVRGDGVTVLELGDEEEMEGEDGARGSARWIAPFLACGDLGSYDADATYHLPADHVSLDPVQPPTAPPYKKALEMRKAAGGAYGKTKGQSPTNAQTPSTAPSPTTAPTPPPP